MLDFTTLVLVLLCLKRVVVILNRVRKKAYTSSQYERIYMPIECVSINDKKAWI